MCYIDVYIIYVLIWRLRRLGRSFLISMWWLEATIFYFLVAFFDPLTSVMALSDRDQFLKNGRHLAGDATDGTSNGAIIAGGCCDGIGPAKV